MIPCTLYITSCKSFFWKLRWTKVEVVLSTPSIPTLMYGGVLSCTRFQHSNHPTPYPPLPHPTTSTPPLYLYLNLYSVPGPRLTRLHFFASAQKLRPHVARWSGPARRLESPLPVSLPIVFSPAQMCRLELCGVGILLYHSLVDSYREKVAQRTTGVDGEKSGHPPTRAFFPPPPSNCPPPATQHKISLTYPFRPRPAHAHADSTRAQRLSATCSTKSSCPSPATRRPCSEPPRPQTPMAAAAAVAPPRPHPS